MDGGVLVNSYRITRGRPDHLQQTIRPILLGELPLLKPGRKTRNLGEDPELQELHRIGFGTVLFGMFGARAERHQLHTAGMKDATVAEAVRVAEGPLPDVGDALDVGVRVHRPDRTRSDAIVIEHPQRPNSHLARIAIAIERKMPASDKPTALFLVDVTVAAHLQHGTALGNLDGALGESHPVAIDDAGQRLTVAVAGAERHEQWGQVLGARMRVSDRGCAVREVGQLVDVTVLESLVRPGVELRRPRRGWRVEPEIPQEGKPVCQEPAADDEHALVAQGPEASTDLEQLLGVEARHRDLQHRHVASGYITVSGT